MARFTRSKSRQLRKAIALEAASQGVHAAADRYGVTWQWVYKCCKQHGVTPQRDAGQPYTVKGIRRTKRISVDTTTVRRMALQGKGQSEIAAELGVSRQRIHQILHDPP